jgi:transposase
MRATRELLRRRLHLMRTRAELSAHVQQTNRQYHRPELGQHIADTANRDGVAERLTDPAVHKSLAVDLALMTYDDARLTALELAIVNRAKQHEANTFYRLRAIPGVGTILALVLRYEIHESRRFPSVQDFASSCRLVTCAKASAGKRYGTAGTKIGTAYLKWAFSEAAVLLLRNNEPGQNYLARLEKTHDKGKALTLLAHTLARAVYDMLKRATVFARHKFLQG